MPLLIMGGCATTTASVGTDSVACAALRGSQHPNPILATDRTNHTEVN
jgi:hypothetical protein